MKNTQTSVISPAGEHVEANPVFVLPDIDRSNAILNKLLSGHTVFSERGSGKTLAILQAAHYFAMRGKDVLVVSHNSWASCYHRKRFFDQVQKADVSLYPNYGKILFAHKEEQVVGTKFLCPGDDGIILIDELRLVLGSKRIPSITTYFAATDSKWASVYERKSRRGRKRLAPRDQRTKR